VFSGEVARSNHVGFPLQTPGLQTVCSLFLALNLPNEVLHFTGHGCVLQIKLSPHSYRLYSCSPSHETILAAKRACADIAVEQDVLGFIMYGDEDTKDVPMYGSASTPPAKGLSLKEFYESLPRPFPESFGEKPDAETLGPGWLNSAIQGARGSRLVANFYFFMNHAFSRELKTLNPFHTG
jgi:hypothetical protein